MDFNGKFFEVGKGKEDSAGQTFRAEETFVHPSDEWWIVVSVIQPIVERVEKTFASLQGMNTLVCEQRRELSRLMCDLMERGHIKGPLTSDEIQAFTVAVEENPRHGIIIDGFCVKQESVIEAIDEYEEFVQIEMDKLKARDSMKGYETVIFTIATFLLQLVAGTSRIVAERDSYNLRSDDELPPVLPLDLCVMSSRDFKVSLQQQKIRLKQTLTEKNISKIDMQFEELWMAYHHKEEGLQQRLKGAHQCGSAARAVGRGATSSSAAAGSCSSPSNSVSSFRNAWMPLGSRFKELREYCGGFATVMPGTSCVASDFSLINWTRDPHCTSLTDFSLEAILHCQQYGKLQEIIV